MRALIGKDIFLKIGILTLLAAPTVGTGAIGGLYSSRLAKTCNITAVCRLIARPSCRVGSTLNPQSLEMPHFGQTMVLAIAMDERLIPWLVVRHVEEAIRLHGSDPFDYVIVTLKSLPEVYNVADMIAPAVSPESTIVLIQNGLGKPLA